MEDLSRDEEHESKKTLLEEDTKMRWRNRTCRFENNKRKHWLKDKIS